MRLPRQPPLNCEHGEPTIAGRIAAQAAPLPIIRAQSHPIFNGKVVPSPVAMVRLHGQPPETAYLKMAA